MRSLLALLACTACTFCCGKSNDNTHGVATKAPATPQANATPCAGAASEHGSVMTWFVDDYAAAKACGAATNKPIIMDLWAPWCHTCLSMKTTVFTDPSMKAIAEQFVFVGIDTDRDQNAATVAKFPVTAWPTFYVIAPDQSVAGRLVGSATASQFVAFAQSSVLSAGPDTHEALSRQGNQAVARGDLAAAEPMFAAALQKAPADFARRPELVLALLQTKAKRHDVSGCVALALKESANLGKASAASDALAIGMGCGEELGKQNQAGKEAAELLNTTAIANWTALVNDPTAQLSVDDRSDAMANLREALDAANKHTEALAIAEKQRALLDDAAAKASTPVAASTYNWPRAEVYVYLNRALDIAPILVASAQALPTDYDPPYRAAWAFYKGQKFTDAALWANKSLARVYGPRKARVASLLVDITKAQGDHPGELAARRELVAAYQVLPASSANPEALAKAKADLAAAEATAAPVK
jgi:thiol-disulfide isomerase/thioredoxin